ncbi:Phosphate regulon transcriptional regulatory protein PhoB (SphR) [Minicystis rosea]|nr:Phosphate regulon transcriptional regulatory protein PhoB (SphR) [Minicystis rosea]
MPSPARVLIVDDSPTILKVVSAILARHGYEPVIARDGLAGIELIKKGLKFDLVLLDFVMPRMNGYQFCRELRSSQPHRALPVVLMSAKGDKIRGQFVQQTGAVDAITKPFDARALVAVIEGALAKTAEGRARPVPEGAKMPEEEPIAESMRPGQLAKQQRLKTAVEVAQRVAQAVTPAIMALPQEERESEAAVMGAIAKAMTTDVVDALAHTLRDVESESGVKELMGGDISAIPLAEILQLLQLQRQTGVLRVSNARAAVTISIRQGLIDFVQSRGAADEYRLGRYFVEQGAVTKEELDEVLSTKVAGGQLIGEALLDSGQVTKEALTEALAKQSSELIYDVLRWPYGRFSFTREAFRAEAEEAKLGLGIAGLVLEGFRRVDEWRLMEGTINFDQVVYVDAAALEAVGDAKLTRIDKLVLGAVDGARTVNEVIKESAVGSFDAIKAVYQFLQSRVLRPRTA